jgi:hypothetical protein
MLLPYNILLILLPPTLALHLSLVHHPASALSPTTSLGHLVLPLLLISLFPSPISATPPSNVGSRFRVPRIFAEGEVNELNEVEGKEERSYGDPSDYPNGAQESGAEKGVRVPRVFAFPNKVFLHALVWSRGVAGAAIVGKGERSYGDPLDYPNSAQENAASGLRIPPIFSLPSLVLNAIFSGREVVLAAVVENRGLRVPRTITRTSPLLPNFLLFFPCMKHWMSSGEW